MFKKFLLAAAILAGGAFVMPTQSHARGPHHCAPHGHYGYGGYGAGYGGGYYAARPVIVPNYGYGTGVPYIGPGVRYGNYGGYSSYRPGLNISIGGNPYGGYGGYGIGSPFGYGSGFGMYLGR